MYTSTFCPILVIYSSMMSSHRRLYYYCNIFVSITYKQVMNNCTDLCAHLSQSALTILFSQGAVRIQNEYTNHLYYRYLESDYSCLIIGFQFQNQCHFSVGSIITSIQVDINLWFFQVLTRLSMRHIMRSLDTTTAKQLQKLR